MIMQGDSPNINYGPLQTDYRRLFYSDEAVCLIVPIQLAPGYGIVKAGTALAKNTSALATGNTSKFFPYSPAAITGAENAAGRAYLVQDSGTATNLLYVTLDDSYKFKVGDDLMIIDNTTSGENLGAITAIDRTSFTNKAKITTTTNVGGTSFTAARFAFVAAEGYDACVGILGKSVDTGVGSKAVGAQASLLLKNFVLYTAGLTNVDSAAVADLSLSSIGLYTYK
jgi:hypothetical protein